MALSSFSGPRGTTPRKDSATLGRISFNNRTRYPSSPTSARRSVPHRPSSGSGSATDRHRSSGGQRDRSLFPHRSRGLVTPGPAASSPQRHPPFTSASRGFVRGTICSDSSAEERSRAPPRSRPTDERVPREPFQRGAATDVEAFAPGPERSGPYSSSHGTPRILETPTPSLTTRQVRPEGRAPASRRPESRLVARDFFPFRFSPFHSFFRRATGSVISRAPLSRL